MRHLFVLTSEFMMKVAVHFKGAHTQVKFKSIKWKVPLSALEAIQIEA